MRKLILAIAILSIGMIGYAVHRQTQGQYEEPIPSMGDGLPEPYPPPEPRPAFHVVLNDDLDPQTQAVHEQLATVLSTLGVPNDRLGFYAALLNTPGYRITGWGGVLEDAEPIPGGYLVTLRVTPDIESDDFGPATGVNSQYCEQYRVMNGNVEYVGFLDPEGMFGKFPDDIRGY